MLSDHKPYNATVIGLSQLLNPGGKFHMPIPEDLDQDKIAEAALAILSLSRMTEPYGTRAWKGVDWDVMNLLFEKGWISDPVGKQKSVGITDEGIKLADQFLEKYFGN